MSGAAPRFRVQSPGGRLTMQTLAAGETAIGRGARAGLVLDDARISRRHALARAGLAMRRAAGERT